MKPGSGDELLELARAGDGAAFDRLVERHQDRIYGLLLRLTGSEEDAEDLAQECFLRAWRALCEFRGEAALRTWLYRIALNLARSEGRSRQRRREVEVPAAALAAGGGLAEGAEMDCEGLESPAVQSGPERAAEQQELAGKVRRALAALERGHREMVVLRDVEGLDYDEIAALAGVSREAVKSRLHRARGALAAELRRLGCEL